MKKCIPLLLAVILLAAVTTPAKAAIRRVIEEYDGEVSPSLHTLCKKVTVFDGNIVNLITDLEDTLKAEGNTATGLSAPQVGKNLCVCVVCFGDRFIELVNPEVVEQYGEETEIEGCLSMPGDFRKVSRPTKVVVEAFDRNGDPIRLEKTGFEARVLMHQIDHLNGMMISDRTASQAGSALSEGSVRIIIGCAAFVAGGALGILAEKKLPCAGKRRTDGKARASESRKCE